MDVDRSAIETCLAYFQLPPEAEQTVAGSAGRQYMGMLWQEEQELLYENPLYLLRQEWWHAYAWALDDPARGFFQSMPADGILLDYGCGTAELCRPLWIAQQRPIVLVEMSQACRGYLRAKYPYATVHVTDDLPPRMEPETLDGLVCTDVFEHVPHPMLLMQDLWNTLRVGGDALLSFSTAYPHAGHLHKAIAQQPEWCHWLLDRADILSIDQYIWARKRGN